MTKLRINGIGPRVAFTALATLALAALVALVAAAPGEAGRGAGKKPASKAGQNLFGFVLQGYNPVIDAPALRQANPASVRILVAKVLVKQGNGACTAAGGACNWGQVDQEIGGAAQAGAEPLPFFYDDPSKRPPYRGGAARQWKQFLAAAVKRYRPGGVFWKGPYQALYGASKVKPVKIWQVWNEPTSPTYFKPKPNVRKYLKLLKLSRQVIKKAHRGAKIMLAGLFASPDKGSIRGRIVAVDFLRQLYKLRGAKNLFDIAAVHPYSRTVNGVIKVIRDVRRVMQQGGDGRTKLSVSELGWSSNRPNQSLLAKGVQGQKRSLQAVFRKLLQVRRRYKLYTVNWFSLRDAPAAQSSCPNCPFAGLLKEDGSPKPAWGAYRGFTR